MFIEFRRTFIETAFVLHQIHMPPFSFISADAGQVCSSKIFFIFRSDELYAKRF